MAATIAAVADRQDGHAARAQLRAAGLTDPEIDWRLATGALEIAHVGVLRVAGSPVTHRGRLWAALLACGPRSVLSHGSAAQVLGLLHDDRSVEVIVPPDVLRRHEGLRVRRCVLPPEEIVVVDGLRLTSWARVLIDVAAVRGRGALMHAIDRTIVLGLYDAAEMDACLRRHPRRAGRRRLIEALALLPDDGLRTASRLESELLSLVLGAGMRRPQVNAPVGPFVADLLWPRERLIVEADGLLWHGGPLARRRDAERQRWLEEQGWRVLRVVWDDVVARPDHTLTRIATALTESSKDRPRQSG